MQVRQYTKGNPEITIFHSFARSNYFVQLKYRFSPPSPRLSRVRLLQCRSLPSLFRPYHPGHPPYGNIDRAQPRDSSPSHPRLFCYTATAFSPSLFLSISFPLLLSLFHSLVPLISFSLHLRHSGFNIQLLATRALVDHSQKAGNEVAYGFCVHTNGRVFHCPPAVWLCEQEEGNRGTEREWERVRQVGRVRRRASWQKSETNE